MKNINNIKMIIVLTVLVIFTFTSISLAKSRTLRMAHLLPVGTSWHKGCEKVKEIVESKTDGEIIIKIYPNGQLGTHKEMVESVLNGTLDICMAQPSLLGDFYKPYQALDFLYTFRDYEHLQSVLNGPIGEELREGLLEKYPIRVFSAWFAGERHLTTTKIPVFHPNDLAGLKIRLPEYSSWIVGFAAMGAIPVPITFQELYMALQQGVVDGEEQSIENIISMKFYEVQKYMTKTAHMVLANFQIINNDLLNSLSERERNILTEAFSEGMKINDTLRIESEISGIETLKKEGMVIIDTDIEPFRELVKDVPKEIMGEEYEDLLERIRLTGK